VGIFSNMKFGVKTYFDAEFADYFKDKADFLEVMAVVGEDYSFLEDYPLPIVVHAMHFLFGVNCADKSLSEKNMEAIDFAVELADKYGAEKIIVHAGRLVNKDCSVEQVVDFLKKFDDRILIENCGKRNNFVYSPENTSRVLFDTGKRLIFDVNHAIGAARELGEDYIKFIERFLKLKPVHFHIGGQKLGVGDGHLFFDESNIPVEEILKMLPSDAWVTIETGTDIGRVEKDLEFLRGLV